MNVKMIWDAGAITVQEKQNLNGMNMTTVAFKVIYTYNIVRLEGLIILV